MISAFFTGVVVAIPTSLVMMKLLNSSLFINNSELLDMNQKISVIITQLDDYREERRERKGKIPKCIRRYQISPLRLTYNTDEIHVWYDSNPKSTERHTGM